MNCLKSKNLIPQVEYLRVNLLLEKIKMTLTNHFIIPSKFHSLIKSKQLSTKNPQSKMPINLSLTIQNLNFTNTLLLISRNKSRSYLLQTNNLDIFLNFNSHLHISEILLSLLILHFNNLQIMPKGTHSLDFRRIKQQKKYLTLNA